MASKLSSVQAIVLEELRQVREHMLPKIPEMDARAVGGLTEGEKIERLGARLDGNFINSYWRGRTIRGLSFRTLHALRDRGLVRYHNGTWYVG